jgi:hypothetical protein
VQLGKALIAADEGCGEGKTGEIGAEGKTGEIGAEVRLGDAA